MHSLPLEPFWVQMGAAWKEESGWKIPAYFTKPEEEYQKLVSSVVLTDQSHRGKIKVTGNDRIDFLNRMLTNDIRSLAAWTSCRALFLSAQGKCLADFRVFVFEDFIMLDTEPELAEASIGLLQQFIITEDVQLKDMTRNYAHLGLEGSRAGQPATAGAVLLSPQASFSGERSAALFIPAENVEKIIAALLQEGFSPCGHDALQKRRLENKIPRFKKDFDETWFLNETGLEETAASETKGCYPGQEVVARLKTYGGVKKKLCL